MQHFWMVWNPHGHAPTMKHQDERSAQYEAERLARANRGQTFFVLCAYASVTSNDVVWDRAESIPF